MAKKKDTEAQLQKAITSFLHYQYPKLLWFHVPNGGRRSAAEGAKFKAMGVLAGVADILIFNDGFFYDVELKSGKGVMSASQKDFKERWCKEFGRYALVTSIEELQSVFKVWKFKL